MRAVTPALYLEPTVAPSGVWPGRATAATEGATDQITVTWTIEAPPLAIQPNGHRTGADFAPMDYSVSRTFDLTDAADLTAFADILWCSGLRDDVTDPADLVGRDVRVRIRAGAVVAIVG